MSDGSHPPSEAEVLERLVQEGMARMRWTRKRAEVAAKRYLNRLGKKATLDAILDRIERLNQPREPAKVQRTPKKRVIKKQLDAKIAAPTPLTIDVAAVRATKKAKKARKKRKKAGWVPPSKMTPEAIAKLPSKPLAPKPRTAKERLERAMGPDDGRRSRGRGWLLQGGSPGLGRRS